MFPCANIGIQPNWVHTAAQQDHCCFFVVGCLYERTGVGSILTWFSWDTPSILCGQRQSTIFWEQDASFESPDRPLIFPVNASRLLTATPPFQVNTRWGTFWQIQSSAECSAGASVFWSIGFPYFPDFRNISSGLQFPVHPAFSPLPMYHISCPLLMDGLCYIHVTCTSSATLSRASCCRMIFAPCDTPLRCLLWQK